MIFRFLSFSLFLACSLLMRSAFAQTQVSAFKNGTAFYIKKIKANPVNGTLILKNAPDATFGTLWFHTPGNEISLTRSLTEDVSEKKEAKTLLESLKAHIGKRLGLTLINDKSYEGTLERVENGMLSLKSNQGKWLQFHPDQVKLLEWTEAPAREFEMKEKKRIIELQLSRNTASQEVEMMYLQKGLSWVPSYSLHLLNDNKARLTLQALLINDAEDLENAEVNLVVGVPNFSYQHLRSPFTSEENLLNFISALNQSGAYTGYTSRADISRQSMTNVMDREEAQDELLEVREMDGQEAEDLFFYKAPKVNLKKGSRAFYEVLQNEIDFLHLYEVNLQSNSEQAYSYQESRPRDFSNQVWHSLQIRNNSKLPWTTGTVMVTKEIEGESKPLSQDKLNYIPQGGKGKIKLTVAPNILVKDSEKETGREENKKKASGYMYDLIQVEAKIEIRNFKNQEVKLNISRNINGELQSSQEKWEVNKKVNLYNSINQLQEVEWEVVLPAGKSKEFTYRYSVYVRK